VAPPPPPPRTPQHLLANTGLCFIALIEGRQHHSSDQSHESRGSKLLLHLFRQIPCCACCRAASLASLCYEISIRGFPPGGDRRAAWLKKAHQAGTLCVWRKQRGLGCEEMHAPEKANAGGPPREHRRSIINTRERAGPKSKKPPGTGLACRRAGARAAGTFFNENNPAVIHNQILDGQNVQYKRTQLKHRGLVVLLAKGEVVGMEACKAEAKSREQKRQVKEASHAATHATAVICYPGGAQTGSYGRRCELAHHRADGGHCFRAPGMPCRQPSTRWALGSGNKKQKQMQFAKHRSASSWNGNSKRAGALAGGGAGDVERTIRPRRGS
jgi:hypothetical protein